MHNWLGGKKDHVAERERIPCAETGLLALLKADAKLTGCALAESTSRIRYAWEGVGGGRLEKISSARSRCSYDADIFQTISEIELVFT